MTTDPTYEGPASVHADTTVDLAIEEAFRAFVERFDEVKPRDHSLLAAPLDRAVFEPRVGGTLFDLGTDGSVSTWARVLAFEPPTRVVFSWDITPAWELEADVARTSEVEVRFTAEAPDRTRVDLDHRHLERHGEGWQAFRGLADDDGWPLYLARLGALA